MTATRVSEVIREWLGWCPNAQVRTLRKAGEPETGLVIPPGSGLFKDRVIHWISLFHNQAILSTIGTFCAGFYMFAGIGGWSYSGLFIAGMLAGLPFSAATGIWYWRIFNEVIRDGPVVLWSRYDRTSGTLTALGIALGGLPILVLAGVLPGFNLLMTDALLGGFISVLFFGTLIALWIWESDNRRLLRYDGMILELERGDNYGNL